MLDHTALAIIPAQRADLAAEMHVISGLLCAADRLTTSQEPEDQLALQAVILAAKDRATAACVGL